MNFGLIDYLNNQDVEYKSNIEISKYSSIGIGGNASLLVFPATKEELINVVHLAHSQNILYRIVGAMTNILFGDGNIDLLLISTKKLRRIYLKSNTVYAEAGVKMSALNSLMIKNAKGGLETLSGIPGTVGGMLYSNAGAFGTEISDFIESVELYDPSNDLLYDASKEKLEFSYRKSPFKYNGLIILGAVLSVEEVNPDRSSKLIRSYRNKRVATQPVGAKSLGSVFKKTEMGAASYLIDQCGLKGKKIGDVSVSEKHAGFFINNGKGRASDFRTLVSIVREKVESRYGVLLDEEIEYIGE